MNQAPLCAACLTPPAAGGVAVIQIRGTAARHALANIIRTRESHPLPHASADRLRLCRIVDGNEVVDEAIVAVRADANTAIETIDVNLHGGPRIVQRVLLLLRRAGIEIVEAAEFAAGAWKSLSPIEHEILPMLARAKTRTVASWLARTAARLPGEVQRIADLLEADRLAEARLALATLLEAVSSVRLLLDGVRVVVLGEPNAGKSTLANALAGREHAIVSETPGTTRDWVEHPASIDGIPFILVDTAGLRATEDALETEAIRRSHQQAAGADLVLQVIDAAKPPEGPGILAEATSISPVRRDGVSIPVVYAWNKADLGLHPDMAKHVQAMGELGVMVSARNQHGIEGVRRLLLRASGFSGWVSDRTVPVTERQIRACSLALKAITSTPADIDAATGHLRGLAVPISGQAT